MASVLDLISYPAGDVLYKQAFDGFEDRMNSMHNSTKSMSVGNINSTSTGNLSMIEAVPDETTKPSYGAKIAREAIIVLILNILLYYWNIWLERRLPTRSRPLAIESIDDRTEKLTDEQVEEEIVKKWIARGKVKRASVNWGNTLMKWVLSMSLGLWAGYFGRRLLEEAVNSRSPWRMKWNWELLLGPIVNWFSLLPLASFAGFVVVPASKRIVFIAGAMLAWTIFFSTFLGLLLPWMQDQQVIWEALAANVTANATASQGGEL